MTSEKEARDCVQDGNRRSLPEKVEQCPAQPPNPWLRRQYLNFIHRVPLFCFSNASSILRMFRISSSDARRADNAPSTRLSADPPKALCIRLPAIWACVCTLGTPGS